MAELSTGRKTAIWVLVGLATLIMFVASLTTWVDRQLLDDNTWKTTSAEVIRDPQVQASLSVYLVNQLYSNVDVAAAVSKRLPDQLKPLAAPAAEALRSPLVSATQVALARPRIQDRFIQASANAHKRLVNVLENKTGFGISTGNGVVTLNLSELLTELAREVGLPQSAIDRIPPDAGTVTLMRSNQLGLAQDAVRAVHVLSAWLLILVLAMYAAAVYLARGARRTTLRTIGWLGVFVGVLLLVVRKVAGNYVIDAIAAPQYHGTGHRVWLLSTAILGQIGFALILYGLLFVAGALLAGPTRPAVVVRRTISPVLNERQEIAWGVVAFAFLLLVLWGGTHALRTWWGVLLIGALIAGGVVALRRQTLAEAAAPPPGVTAQPSGEADYDREKGPVLT